MNQLPEYPYGDPESGDAVSVGEVDLGDLVIEQGDLDEQGAPRRRIITPNRIANALATRTAKPADSRAIRAIQVQRPDIARHIQARAHVQALSQNKGVFYEHIKGGKIISSDLGVNARLTPQEVQALKSAVYGQVPFSPTIFPFTGSGTLTVDVIQSLFGVIGATPTLVPGYLIILAASTLNLNQGVQIGAVRKYGSVNSSQQQSTNIIELDSGVKAVKMLLLSAQIFAGTPRFFAPTFTGNASADTTRNVVFTGVPTNYSATLRPLTPGDAEVNEFLNSL